MEQLSASGSDHVDVVRVDAVEPGSSSLVVSYHGTATNRSGDEAVFLAVYSGLEEPRIDAIPVLPAEGPAPDHIDGSGLDHSALLPAADVDLGPRVIELQDLDIHEGEPLDSVWLMLVTSGTGEAEIEADIRVHNCL